MNQKKYLVLNSDTFIWNKHNQFLMYNCESKQSFFFYGVDVISEYIFKLQNINNLYVVEINIGHLKKTEFAKWISILVEKNMGRLLELPENHKIIGFPPLLNLQCDVDRIDKEEGRDIGEFVGMNFNELSINIGGDGIFPELYKQILYPIKSKDVMDIRMLDNFLNSVNLQYLQVINLVGELFSYEYYQQLVQSLMKFSIHKHLYMTSSYVCRHIHELNELELFTFDLYIYYDNLDELIFLGNNLNVNKYIFHWFTGSMPQLEKAIELGCYFSINPGMLKTKSGMEVIKAIPIDHVLLETDAPFALKVQHIDEIEKELKRTMSRISDVIGFDISDIINKNSKEVFCY